MSKTQATILIILGALVVAVLFGLGYVVLATPAGIDLPIVSNLRDPHSSPEAVARAWLNAVVAGDCDKAKGYISPDEDGFFCGGDDSERIVAAAIDQIDADPTDSPLAEYRVTFYGTFVLHLHPMSGSPDEMDKLHPVEKERIGLAVKEIDGKYYVSASVSSLYLMLLRPIR